MTRAASVAGLATYAVAIAFSSPGGDVESFFNVWFYNGLLLLACVIVGARAILVPRERAAWTAFTAAMACWIFGEVWYAAVHPETYPSVGDVGFIGFYPLTYLGIVALLRARTRSIGGTLWLDGLTASLAAAALGAAVLVELVLRSTEGSTSTVATNLAYPLGDLLLLSAVFGVFSLTRWRPGRRWLLLGLGVLVDRLRRRHLPLPERRRHVRRGIVDRHPLARRRSSSSRRRRGRSTGAARSSRSKASRCSRFRPPAH